MNPCYKIHVVGFNETEDTISMDEIETYLGDEEIEFEVETGEYDCISFVVEMIKGQYNDIASMMRSRQLRILKKYCHKIK
jgi:hypothetical protein